MRCALRLLPLLPRQPGSECTHYSFAQLVQSNAVTIAQPAIGHGPVSWPITRRVPGSVLRRCVLQPGTWGFAHCSLTRPAS